MIWALLAGAGPVLAFPRVGLGWLAWVALMPAILLFRRAGGVRRAAVLGWWFGAGYILAAMYWTMPSIGPGLLLVGLVFGAPFAGFGAAVWACREWAGLLVVPAVWVVVEFARSWHVFGGPWALFGATQWKYPVVLGLAGVGGVWLVGFVIVLVNMALVLAGSDRRALAVVAGAGLAIPVVYAAGDEAAGERKLTVALVQPGIVHDPVTRFEEGLRITAELPETDLVIWGESSVGFDLTRSPELLARLKAPGALLLVNEDARDGSGRISKSSVLIGRDGEQGRYVKTRLVPFGEYIPLRPALGWLTRISKAAGEDRVPGTGPKIMDVGGVPIAPLVCFESAFPDLGRATVALGAQAIVIQSSTSTFQHSWAPAQHASLAAVRAAETGRPVVQAALTGVSAAFDARGRPIAWLDTGRRGSVVATLGLPDPGRRTLYSRLGDVVPLFCLLIVAGAGVRPVTEKLVRAR